MPVRMFVITLEFLRRSNRTLAETTIKAAVVATRSKGLPSSRSDHRTMILINSNLITTRSGMTVTIGTMKVSMTNTRQKNVKLQRRTLLLLLVRRLIQQKPPSSSIQILPIRSPMMMMKSCPSRKIGSPKFVVIWEFVHSRLVQTRRGYRSDRSTIPSTGLHRWRTCTHVTGKRSYVSNNNRNRTCRRRYLLYRNSVLTMSKSSNLFRRR
mmetsp:Transcript_48789/g.118060  ORF Transcript_48789/g.118060 Transcript_48789/m.118060 type:complete len:210 (-) Transcript_48789:848-1477(-)